MSAKQLISSGSTFESLAGYSRAVLEHGLVHVSGTTGFDYAAMTISDDVVAQTHQCFSNISAALKQAGASLDDVVRVHYLLTDPRDFNTLAPIFGEYFKKARPAATAMIVGLVDPRMQIEIEVTARIAQAGKP
jgi:enamine deaminase RidA (YjgF/YER057c/UK114 family)